MPEPGPAQAAGLPPAIGDWHLRLIPSGVWLSSRTGQVPRAVLALTQEPERVSVVVDAKGPGVQTDNLLSELFSRLSGSGLTSVRLVLPWGADRYGLAASRAYGLEVVAVDGALTVTPHGYVLARSRLTEDYGDLPRWWRFLPDGEAIPGGMLSPSPAWERELADIPEWVAAGVAVDRVPAGLALSLPDASADQVAAAHAVWPDPERITIVVDGTGAPSEMLHDALAGVLLQVPRAISYGARLWWPRAGADAASPALHELARISGVELIAPSADVSPVEGSYGLCHGPAGVAPWIRFTGDPPGEPMEPLYPVPGWQQALGQADLTSLPTGLAAERVHAGVCVYRRESRQPRRGSRALATTARCVLPDPARATIIAAGDADSPSARQDLEAVLDRLPAAAKRSLRIVFADAAAGGAQSYAQVLADRIGSNIIAPTGAWTATPGGRLHAVVGAQPQGTDGWQGFFPRHQAGTAPTEQASPGVASALHPPADPGVASAPPPPANPSHRPTPNPPANPGPAPAPSPSQPPAPKPPGTPGLPPANLD